MLTNEWNNNISKDTISNCFRHCDFFRAKCSSESFEPLLQEIYSNDEFENISQFFSNLIPNVTLDDYIDCDTKIPVSAD